MGLVSRGLAQVLFSENQPRYPHYPYWRTLREPPKWPLAVERQKGDSSWEKLVSAKNLWFSSENPVRTSVVFCEDLRLPNLLISRVRWQSANICENLQKLSPFSFSHRRPDSVGQQPTNPPPSPQQRPHCHLQERGCRNLEGRSGASRAKGGISRDGGACRGKVAHEGSLPCVFTCGFRSEPLSSPSIIWGFVLFVALELFVFVLSFPKFVSNLLEKIASKNKPRHVPCKVVLIF